MVSQKHMAKLKRKILGKDETRPENKPVISDEKKSLEIEAELLKEASLSSQVLVRRAKTAFRTFSDSRKRYDWEWLSRDLFRRGYQFTNYNSQTKVLSIATTNNARIPINLTTAAMRSIRNQVTAFKPKWEVLPNRLDDEAKMNAKYSGKLLDYVFNKERLKKKIKETVTQGLQFSVGGPWQIGWEDAIKNEDGSLGFIYIWLLDPFDFYTDPNGTDGLRFSDHEGVIKAVRRSLDQVRGNTNYSEARFNVKTDGRVAASEYKQFLLQSIKSLNQYQTEETETCIVYEGYFKERDIKTGKTKMRLLTWVDSTDEPLRNELLDTEDYPFRMYQADINPLEVYGESWAKHVIPINRVINALESSEYTYNYRYNKGRLVMDKDAGIRIIDNQHGSIIEKKRGSMVASLPLQPLAMSSQAQIQRMRQYFEDISGAHDVSLGRIPVGVHSGIGIAELKQADATNQDDLVDNLEDFMVEVARKILNVVSDNITFPRLIKATNIAGDADYFAIIGETGLKGRSNKKTVKIGKKEYPLAVISSDNSITVQIGSWLAYTKQQRQQELKNLFTAGVIDQRTLLEHLEFGDIDNIIARTKQEAIIKKRRGMQQAGIDTKVTEEELALSENEMMLLGNMDVTALPTDDHEIHIAVHSEQQSNDLVRMHIDEHKALKRQAMGLPNELTEEQVQTMVQEGQMTPVTQPVQGMSNLEGIVGMPQVPQETVPVEQAGVGVQTTPIM